MILKSFIFIGLLFLPGFITFSCLRKKTSDFLDRLLSTLLLSILVVSLVGIILAELSLFSLSKLTAISGLYVFMMLLVFQLNYTKLRKQGKVPEPAKDKEKMPEREEISFLRRSDPFLLPIRSTFASPWLLMGILLIAVGLGSFSFEYILGGRDPGVYINTGINLAHTGSLVIQDKLLEGMNPSQQELFYSPGYYKYLGFFIDESTITPQFLPLFPVWVAIFYLTLGLKGTLWINTLFGVLGILSIYLVGRQMFHPFVGLITALLLTINPVQIWYMRYPSPEVLLQFLIFAGIYTYERYQRESTGWLGVISAMALGLTFLAKPLALLLPIPIGLYLYGKTFKNFTSLDAYFVFPFILCLLHAVFHIYYFNSYYVLGHLERFKTYGFLLFFFLGLLALLWFAPKVGAYRRVPLLQQRGRRRIWEKIGTFSILSSVPALRLISVVLLFTLSLYGYFARPLLAQKIHHMEMNRLDRNYDMDSLIHLGWYLSPVVVLLGVVGASLFIYRRMDKVNLLFFLIGLTYSFFVLKGTQDAWDHFWIMRRYVPVVIPVFLLFTGYALWNFSRLKILLLSPSGELNSRNLETQNSKSETYRSLLETSGKPLAILILCALLSYTLFIAWPVIKHQEHQGIIHFMDQLSGSFTDSDILVLDHFDVSVRVAPPLEYIYRKNVLILYRNALENYQEFIRLAHQWNQEGRKVYFLTPFPQSLELVRKFTFDIPEMEQAIGHIPRKINRLQRDLYVYQLTEKDGTVRNFLNLGINDFALIEGFHHIEESPDGSKYRWTKETARVLVPGASKLRIRMRGLRPDSLPAAKVEVFIENTPVGVLQPLPEFQDHEMVIPSHLIKNPLILTLRVPTWKPSEVLKTPDARDLGVMIEKIEVVE